MSKSIISILVMALSVGIFILVGKPAYDEIALLKEQKTVISAAGETAKSLQASWGDLVNRYNAVSDTDKERLELMTPSFVDNVKLMIEIEELAKKHKLSLKDIDIDKDKETQSGSVQDVSNAEKSIGIKFKVTGKYQDFLGFLAELEYSLRVVDVKSLSFRPERGTVKDLKKPIDYYSYDVEVTTYWLPQ
ncbi:MAG TPA: hypothetical protein VGE63_00325 [Candidatus Paceibacterota bacterium]